MTTPVNAFHAPVEQPVLWLGLAGFPPDQRDSLEAALDRPPGLPSWRSCALGEADAWWVNGAKVKLMPDGNLKVAAGLPTEHSLRLDLNEVDRPVAFATPLPPGGFEPRCVFDPISEPSIHAVLLKFEGWLRPLRAQFVLGSQIIERGERLRHGIYHVSRGGNLLAVLDFRAGRAAISPTVHPVDLWDAKWDKRPVGAGDLPESFSPITPAQLAWTYVRRTDRDMLPARYRTEVIYYRHVPQVPLRWLRDSQLLVLRELLEEPSTLADLRQLTGLSAGHIEHDLSCLYYAGAVTTTRAKAAASTPARGEGPLHSSGPGLDSFLGDESRAHDQSELTAPALFEHRRGRTAKPDDADSGG